MKTNYANLLVSETAATSLRDFAAAVYRLVGISQYQERESSHYYDGYYFTATAGGRIFEVMLTSDKERNELPYWLELSNSDEAESLTREEVDDLALKLVRLGYRVVRVEHYCQPSEQRFEYRTSAEEKSPG